MSVFQIHHDIEVQASADTVWSVLTDFERYGEWNPFVVWARCSLTPGEPIEMKVRLIGPAQPQVEIIDTVQPGEGFAYCMKPFPLGALSSRRSHRIVPLGEGRCCYESRFELRGWMMPVVRGLMKSAMQRGFAGMSEGVRQRAEALTRA